MIVSLIAAVAENYVIGKDGDLPWRLPSDLKWFKQQTIGKTCLMGRLTYESLGFPLPSRRIIVISSQPVQGCESARSVEEAIQMCELEPDQELMILGGSGLYKHFLSIANRFYLTVVHASPEGDTTFPPIDPKNWRATFSQRVEQDERNPIAHTFYILERTDNSESQPQERLSYADWA